MARVFKRKGSPKFYGNITRADGTRKQTPLTMDRDTSRKLLARLQGEQDRLRALGLTEQSKRRIEPLTAHVEAYREHLTAKGGTPEHTRQTIGRITRVMRALGATRISDLSSGKVSNLLEKWRRQGIPESMETRKGRKPKPLSRQSSNHYVRSLRGFSRWLWTTEITDTDVLRGLKVLNARVDRRHVRRALSEVELSRLIRLTHSHGRTIQGKDWTMSGPDRSMLYRVASMTGLRASELRSLCQADINIDSGIITLRAENSKHRKQDVIPIHPALLDALIPWLANKPLSGPLWPGRWHQMGAKMIRRDLQLCGGSYRAEDGRVFDFHSLRGQFITSLARSGVSPSIAMKLARHSDVNLTMNHYTRLESDTLREALATVPGPQ